MARHLGADANKGGSPTLEITIHKPLGKAERKKGWLEYGQLGFYRGSRFPSPTSVVTWSWHPHT